MRQGEGRKKSREEILELSVELFAERGYDRVSMREVATAVGFTPAAIYHHFKDKEELYLEVMAHEFKKKRGELTLELRGREEPWFRLEQFIAHFAQRLASDHNFLRLIQWLRLDRNEARHQKLAAYVFHDIITALQSLAAELDNGYDPLLLAMSIIALVSFPFESTTRKFMPGYRPEQECPTVVAKHVITLLRNGLGKRAAVTASGA